MLFNSIEFLLFFPLVVAVYFLLPHKVRWLFLLAASCYFYMSFIPKYILILASTTLIDYFGALLVARFRESRRLRRLFLTLALLLNVGMLVYFKYLGLFEDTFNFFGQMLRMETVVLPEVILPIGISFHTFQSMGYLIDVYRGDISPEKNILRFALFLMFFPQLVAGPIERAGNLMHQLRSRHRLTYENLSLGGRMMLWGMVKKVVVADNLAKFVDAAYSDVENMTGPGLLLAVVFFAVQIYCDFSGYSDIAIGAAKVMDIDLMANFRTPYFSHSITEFWRRWHISLSTWFKDYVYIPLGGNRVSKPRWCLNQLITFSVSGIWHGANWTFVVWGLLNGVYILFEKLTKGLRERAKALTQLDRLPALTGGLSLTLTFCVVCLTWIFFRAESFGDAFYVLSHIFAWEEGEWACIMRNFPLLTESRLYISLGAIALLWLVDFCSRKGTFATWIGKAPTVLRLAAYTALTVILVLFGAFENQSFIYFQF